MGRKKKDDTKSNVAKVNPALGDFEISINSFGEIVTNYDLDKINDFLDKNVEDKKLKDKKLKDRKE